MAALIIPSRRVVQPQGPAEVDWGNPLALGANVWTPQRPFALQSANNVQPGAEIAYSSAPISAAGVGRQWTRSANAGINFGLQQIIRQNVGVTVLVLAAPRSQTALKVPVSQRVASGAFTQTELVFNCQDIAGITTATAGSVLLANYSNIGTGVAAASQIDGQPHCWVAGNSSTSGYIFRDGVSQTLAVNVRTPAALTVSTQRTRIGNIADDGGTTWPHDDPLYLVVVWDRMLSDSEARAVSANPWQLFRPLQRRIIVDMGAGGATNYNLTAVVGAYSLTGIDATLTYTPAAVNYSLTADAGAYALAGVDAGVTFGRRLLADAGSYSLTGIDATLAYVPGGGAFTLTADTGIYSLTGNDAGLTFARRMTADVGSYTLNGVDAGLLVGRRLTADTGAYSLAGIDADLIYTSLGPTAYTLTAETGAYALTGNAAGLTYTDGGVLIDTHDGFWAKEWARIRAREKRKYREEIEERIEAIADEIEQVEQQIAEVKQVPKPKKAVVARDFYAEQARIVEQLIARRNQLIDEEDEELLLLL